MAIHEIHLDEKAYEEVFNSSAESILVIDSKGRIIMANPRSTSLFEYDESELLGKGVSILIPERFRASHDGHMHNYSSDPSPRQMGKGRDLVGRKKDGKEFPIEVSLNPASFQGENVVIVFLIDITERKKIEEALEKSEQQLIEYATELERRVKNRTKELDRAVKKLGESNKKLESEITERKKAEEEARKSLEKEKELNELKSRFVSMASHEFRTPLSTILSSVSLIAKYQDADKAERRTKHIERIKSNVHSLTGILNDFLSLDKLEEGKIQNNPVEIEIVSFMAEIVDELSLILKSGQSISFDSDITSHSIMIDPQILKHILSNLVSNAVKYSDAGDKIKVELKSSEGDITFSVIDEGIGIPENERKHLFERFFRAHNVSHIQGTGLGLNLVHRYLKLLGGRITYTDNNGKGSVFTVSLTKE